MKSNASNSGYGDLRSELEAYLIDYERGEDRVSHTRLEVSEMRMKLRSIDISETEQLIEMEKLIVEAFGLTPLEKWRVNENRR